VPHRISQQTSDVALRQAASLKDAFLDARSLVRTAGAFRAFEFPHDSEHSRVSDPQGFRQRESVVAKSMQNTMSVFDRARRSSMTSSSLIRCFNRSA